MTGYEFVLNRLQNASLQSLEKDYLCSAIINQLKNDLRGDKRLFPADGAKKMKLLKLILATFRKEISNETSEEIANKLIAILVEIIQTTEPLFYRRQLVEIIYECELLFERFITLDLKKGITIQRKYAVFNKLSSMIDTSRTLIMKPNTKFETTFTTSFCPGTFEEIKKLVPAGEEYICQIRNRLRKDEIDELKSEIDSKSRHGRFQHSYETYRCQLAADIILNQDEHELLSERLQKNNLSLISRQNRKSIRSKIKIIKWINVTTFWAIEQECISQHSEIKKSLANYDWSRMRLKNYDSQNAIIQKNGKLYRAHLMPNRDWFCIDEGFIVPGDAKDIQLFEVPEDPIFNQEGFLCLVKLDGIIPTLISQKIANRYFKILNTYLHDSLTSNQIVQNIPKRTISMALDILNNTSNHSNLRLQCAKFVELISSLRLKHELSSHEDSIVKSEIKNISESFRSLTCNLNTKNVNRAKLRLMNSVLSTILSLTKERSINFYRILIGQLKSFSFYEDLISILRLPENEHSKLVQSLKYRALMIIRKMGILAIQYGESQNILRSYHETKESATISVVNQTPAPLLNSEIIFDYEPEDSEGIVDAANSYTALTFETDDNLLAITGSHRQIRHNHHFDERERLGDYEIFNDEFNIFCPDEAFASLRDGNLTDLSCALLNGKRDGTLWIGLTNQGMINGVSSDQIGRDRFRQRMFKLMRSMFPPVMNQNYKMIFYEVRSADIGQKKCLVSIQFKPNGLMYSTPQKRCCIRKFEEGFPTIDVLDCKAVVQRCLDQDSRPYIIEINRLKRISMLLEDCHEVSDTEEEALNAIKET